MSDSTFLTRVILKNYKSIAKCTVPLGPLVFLVGPNGSGKSNFLDALRLVADSLNTSLDHALRERGGIKDVRRRSGGHPTHFSVRLEFLLPDGRAGHFAFQVGARAKGGYEVQSEECRVEPTRASGTQAHYSVEAGVVTRMSSNVAPPASPDRLYLVNASGLPEFRPVYDSLSRMAFYSLNPASIRDLQPPDAGEVLHRDGRNLASVLGVVAGHSPQTKSRIEEYLAKVVPGVTGVEVKHVGPKETIEFRQQVKGNEHPWRFLAANMSDGTLRGLAILLALFQSRNGQSTRVPLVGIEEPELALHPAAAGVLRDSLRDASRVTQVVVTSHSPDLLDDGNIGDDMILAVRNDLGVTSIGPPDAAGRSAIRDRLYTPGELLRQDQLVPDTESYAQPADLFEGADE